LLLRRERPDQRDNPPDKSPTGKQIQDKNSDEVGPFAGQKSGQKIKKQRNERENWMEMEKGHKTQRRDQHGARSAKTHDVFYHGLLNLSAAVKRERKARSSGAKARFHATGICERILRSTAVETQTDSEP
jgi:hypothetical protein